MKDKKMYRKLIQYKERSEKEGSSTEADIPMDSGTIPQIVAKLKKAEKNAYLATVLTNEGIIGSRARFEQNYTFLKDLIEKTAHVQAGVFKRCALEYLETMMASYRGEELKQPGLKISLYAVEDILKHKKIDGVLNNIRRYLDFLTAELILSDYQDEELKKIELLADTLKARFDKTEVMDLPERIAQLRALPRQRFTDDTLTALAPILNNSFVFDRALAFMKNNVKREKFLKDLEGDERKVLKEFIVILALYYSMDKIKKVLNEDNILTTFIKKIRANFKELKNAHDLLKEVFSPQLTFNFLFNRLGKPDKVLKS